jgi:type III restriction enzyme
VLASRTIKWVYPESIQGDNSIRVVLAKEAISTGWDCPRAEVLYSERPAKDATHIAQVIGRMVRQPLARRIATDDALNSVSCYLPYFDRTALKSIKEALEGKGDFKDIQVGPDAVRSPKVFERNASIPADVFDVIESLPSIPTPDPMASPLRRAKSLVRLLADDAMGKALLPNADALLTKLFNSRLDGLAVEYAELIAKNVTALKTTSIASERVNIVGATVAGGVSTREVETHAADVDRDSRRIINAVREGVGKAYYAYRVEKAALGESKLETRIQVAALLQIDSVREAIDAAATKFVRDHLHKFAVEIKATTGATRDAYRKVQEQTVDPEPLTVELRDNEKTATKDANGNALPLFTGHIYSTPDGKYPLKMNDWEEQIILTEVARPSFVAWYRNPQRASANSLRIAYQDDAKKWTSVQTDFLVISERDDGKLAASIIDPHGDHLADAKAKLLALADYAETYSEHFVRVESVAKGSDGSLRSLDLLDASIRKSVRAFEGAKVTALYESAGQPYM